MARKTGPAREGLRSEDSQNSESEFWLWKFIRSIRKPSSWRSASATSTRAQGERYVRPLTSAPTHEEVRAVVVKAKKVTSPKKNRRNFSLSAKLAFAFLSFVVIGIGVGTALWVHYTPDKLPQIKGLEDGKYHPKQITILTDDTGQVEIWDIFDPEGGRRLVITPEEVKEARILTFAFVRAEDKTFFEPRTFTAKLAPKLRAAKNNFMIQTKARIMGQKPPPFQGGSSIPEQVVKLLKENKGQGLGRKVVEYQKAADLEEKFDKTTILWVYLNEVPMPKNRIGVKEGARFLFGKNVTDLTPAQAATIAALAKSPEFYKNIPRLTERRNWILSRLKDAGDISPEEYKKGVQSKIEFVNHEAQSQLCLEYVPLVKHYLAQQLNAEGTVVNYLGFRIRTSCNLRMQQAARQALAQQMVKIKNADGATICIDPITRKVKCLVAHGDFDPTTIIREPGSAFKPNTWATAYAQGMNPDSVVNDSPLEGGYNVPGSRMWQPGNHDGKYLGQITMRMAMAVSSNVVAARFAGEHDAPGPQAIRTTARETGYESPLQLESVDRDGKKKTNVPLSIAIGSMAVTPLEVANSYATYASGKVGQPSFIEGVASNSGNEEKVESELRNVEISTEVLGMVTYTLQGVIELQEGTAHSALAGQFGNWIVAGKTGTTNSSRDAWFAGYTANMACVSWIGSRGKSLGKHVYGGNSAAHAWKAPMLEAIRGKAPQTFPYPLYNSGQAAEQAVTAPEKPQEPVENKNLDSPEKGDEPPSTEEEEGQQ